MFDISQFTTWADFFVAAFAAGGTLAYGVRRAMLQLRELRELKRMANTILTELQPNGGGSMRDAVDKTAKDVAALKIGQSINSARQWAMVAGAREAVIEFDAAGLCVRANRSFLQLTDRDLTEVRGNGWTNAVKYEDRDRVLLEWNQALKYARAFEASFKICDRDGNHVHAVKCTATPITTAEGDLVGYMGRVDSNGAL